MTLYDNDTYYNDNSTYDNDRVQGKISGFGIGVLDIWPFLSDNVQCPAAISIPVYSK